MERAQIGLVGLAVMGANLALNIADKGYRIAIHNRTVARIDEALSAAGDLSDRMIGCKRIAYLVDAVKRPRAIIIMVRPAMRWMPSFTALCRCSTPGM